jgi:hypothetical protein
MCLSLLQSKLVHLFHFSTFLHNRGDPCPFSTDTVRIPCNLRRHFLGPTTEMKMAVHTLNGQFVFIIQRPQHESKPECLVRLGLFPGSPVMPEHAITNHVMADQTMFCLEANVSVTDYWTVRQKTSWPKGPFSSPRNTIQEAWRHHRLATRKLEALVPITEPSGALFAPCSAFELCPGLRQTARCLSMLFALCLHCSCTVLLPIQCLFTAYPVPIHCLTAYSRLVPAPCFSPLLTASLLVRQYALFLTHTHTHTHTLLITASLILTTPHSLSLEEKRGSNRSDS